MSYLEIYQLECALHLDRQLTHLGGYDYILYEGVPINMPNYHDAFLIKKDCF